MSYSRAIPGFLFLGILLLGILLYSPREPGPKTVTGETSDLRVSIERLGASRAYDALAKEIAHQPQDLQHTAAHEFGAALYAAEGVNGLSICDARFSYGCFHEFLGRAIADLGIGSVPALNKRCFDDLGSKGLSCQHGIGHGIQAYMGYEEKNLIEALDTCRDLPGADPIGGCFGGAFMEYNFQTMLGDQALVRASTSDMTEPCSTLAPVYKKACFFWQPQWWYVLLTKVGNEEPTFKQLGELCSSVPTEHTRACFEGIGNITAEAADFSGERSARLCELVSTDSTNQLFCISIAANSLGAGGGNPSERGEQACSGLEEEARNYCMAYARNEGNILMVKEPPRI